MASLIEGWLQPVNGRPFVDNSSDATTSPRKVKSYLTVYDSFAALGYISSGIFMDCELRLFLGNQTIEEKVIHIHGRFSVVAAADEGEDPRLLVEVHRFVVMGDPANDKTPDDLRTSVTLSGRVVSATDSTATTADKFFILEVSEYIRDQIETFSTRFVISSLLGCFLIHFFSCRLNRTTSKRWDKTSVPIPGTTILVSGFLDGDSPATMQVEVETMQFITPTRGGEGVGPAPQTPGKSKFGVPIRFVH